MVRVDRRCRLWYPRALSATQVRVACEEPMAGNRSTKKLKNRAKVKQAAGKRKAKRHLKSIRRGMRSK
jgi:hypothetical protein